MSMRQTKVQTQLGRASVQTFTANDRVNQMLIEHLDPAVWRAKPPDDVRFKADWRECRDFLRPCGVAYLLSTEAWTH